MEYLSMKNRNRKSVQSIHSWQSVIQTSYDIVKAHGGELKVETKEEIGTTFTILLKANEA